MSIRCVRRTMLASMPLSICLRIGLRIGLRVCLRRACAGIALSLAACGAESPPRGLEETCAKACSVRAGQCTPRECSRGCNLVLDRLAENEGGNVIACVSAAKRACDDRTWAACAMRIGPHADGGPPAPPPPPGADDRSAD